MFVCVCKGITDQQIKSAVVNGANSVATVNQKLGIASQCGRCASMARDIIKDTLVEMEQSSSMFYQVA